MNAKTSPYLLIFRDSSPEVYKEMSPEQRQQLLQQWNAWYEGLAAAGKLQAGHPLESGGRIVSGASGRVVDGPFAEAKEAVGGFFLLTVSGLEEATEIARQCPSLRLGLGLSVEVRPVAECCPVLSASKAEAEQELVHA
jgi:hypothetical protein